MFMRLRIVPVILLASVLVFSCKKTDVVIDNSNANHNGSNNSVVYNVNKATFVQLVNDVRKNGCTCGTTVMPPVGAVAWNDQVARLHFSRTWGIRVDVGEPW